MDRLVLQQPIQLQALAEDCVQRLQELKKNAEPDKVFHPRRPTYDLLVGVERDVNDSLRLLQAWNAQFAKGNHDADSPVLGSVSELFCSLKQCIGDAGEALHDRLRHSSRWLFGFRLRKRFTP